MKHLFWMEPYESVMILIILIRMTQRIVTKTFAKNVLIIMDIARDYIEIILASMNVFVK